MILATANRVRPSASNNGTACHTCDVQITPHVYLVNGWYGPTGASCADPGLIKAHSHLRADISGRIQ